MKQIRLTIAVLLISFIARAQNYTALNGSSYTGSVSVHNNPASIVNTPSRWDITLLGFQDKHSTNFFTFHHYSLLSNPASSEYEITPGQFKRYGRINTNLNLLNTRIALNERSAIAFGVNLKSYTLLRTSNYNFIDTLKNFAQFFAMNTGASDMHLDITSSSWAEIYASYGRTLFDNEAGRLNAGITVKANRGLSGIFGRLTGVNFNTNLLTDPATYTITSGQPDFGYSSNFDHWDNNKGFGQNFGHFASFTESGASMDIGLEYLIKTQALAAPGEKESYFDYDWKFGLSFLDLGYGQYQFGKYSTAAASVLPNVTDQRLDQAFDSTVNNISAFKDSLSALYLYSGTYAGKYRINHPARVVLNIDHFITGAFFVNADLSLDISSAPIKNNFRVSDLNLLTITPRWETYKTGFYMPVYYNNLNQLWVGGAVRVGPVLLGVHNWSNIFSKNKINRGGGYIALILHAKDLTGSKGDKRLDCPR